MDTLVGFSLRFRVNPRAVEKTRPRARRLLPSLLMKRLFGLALFGVTTAVLGGCPVYSGNQTNSYEVCNQDGCYWCPENTLSNGCVPAGGGQCQGYEPCGSVSNDAGIPSDDTGTGTTFCTQPSNCPEGYTCAASGTCQLGDCSVTGCVAGYSCELENGSLTCVSEGTVPDSGAGEASSSGDSSSDDAGVACQSNLDCPTSDLCLDGVCVPPPGQCFDGSQCVVGGDKCVQGACSPPCTISEDGGGASTCPTGYACMSVDDASSAGVCLGNPTPCESNPSVCPTGTVCAQDHCVLPCNEGGACAQGEECVQGGCVPNQNAKFICATDGVQDACESGSICIDHNCYIACSPDAGAAACQTADQFNECKPVTAAGATYYVCGSSTDLGTECNPTLGQLCANAGAICIDGYCY
jgi:hypothetical protein